MESWRRQARSLEDLGAAERTWLDGEGAAMWPQQQGSRSGGGATFFRRAHPAWMVLVAAGMGYYGWVVFSPTTIPYKSLGPLGTFTSYLVENHKACLNIGYGIAWLIHVVETVYALKLCRDKGITDRRTQFLWAIQTLLFGITSLSHLLKYDPLKETKHQ